MNRRALYAILVALFIGAGALVSQTPIGTGNRFAQDGKLAIITHSREDDPCLSSAVVKSSASIAIASGTTTQLVAPSGTTTVYVCGGTFTIAPSATTADTAQFITGTGATCGTNTATKTGTFGNGDLTAAAPVVPITLAGAGTAFSGAAGAGLCIVTAGTAVSVQGYITYIQQ